MSFLNDTKNFGLVITILGLFEVIGGVVGLVDSLTLGAVGALLAGILVLLAGFGIYKRSMPGFMTKLFPEGYESKFGVLVGMMFTISVAQLIANLFALDFVGIVLALILLVLALTITNDKKNAFDKIIWILLLVISVIFAIEGFLAIFAVGGDNILLTVANLIIAVATAVMYFLLVTYLLDGGVKKKFGM